MVLEEIMTDNRLVRVGGYFALIVAVMQVVGNALHPPIPDGTVDALTVIHNTALWIPVHVIITISYFMFIPFVIGASAAFQDKNSPLILAAKALVIAGATIGAVQILTHLTYFKYLADTYFGTSDAALQQMITFNYEAFWPYAVALEIAHLCAIFISVSLFGIAMLSDSQFARWMAYTGIAGGLIATFGILSSKIIFNNDIIFGVSLLPLVIWIFAVGLRLLRLSPASQKVGVVRREQAA
jgi:hypothetical protein